MCMEGMGEGPKIMGQNIINCKTVSIFISGGRLLGHIPPPPVPPVLMDIRENVEKKSKCEKVTVVYAHMALVLPESIMYHKCGTDLICKYHL